MIGEKEAENIPGKHDSSGKAGRSCSDHCGVVWARLIRTGDRNFLQLFRDRNLHQGILKVENVTRELLEPPGLVLDDPVVVAF